jgi:hypothetical protein
MIPVDDDSLRLVEEAIRSALRQDDPDEDPIRVEGFSLNQLLDFWSGVDRSQLVTEDAVRVYRDPVLGTDDLILALVAEVRRLRMV